MASCRFGQEAPGGEFLQCLSVDWSFNFENLLGASFRILVYSRMLSDVSRQLCRSLLQQNQMAAEIAA